MYGSEEVIEKRAEERARRAAGKVGLLAKKSRRAFGFYNQGGFMLLDPFRNFVVWGERFDLSADAVIEFCRERAA